MKRGYKRLLVFNIFLFIILLLNSFLFDVLSRYRMIIFLIIVMFIFLKMFGYEKDKHRYIKDIILEIAIFLFTFFILYYLLGVIIGFTASHYYSADGMIMFVIPVLLYVILREIFRYMMLCKAEGNNLLIIITTIIFIFLDITSLIPNIDYSSGVSMFKFLALSVLPAISSNIVFSYLTMKVGYKPVIFYALIIELYIFLLPIVPDPGEYITAVIKFTLPIVLWYKIYSFFEKDRDAEIEREYNKKHVISLVGPAIIAIVLVYFTSGYFHYFAVAVASGSMKSKINKGDAVIIEKIDKKYDELEVGQVLAFYQGKRIYVHRLVDMDKNNDEFFFYTKGDANDYVDNFVVKEEDIIGIVRFKIPCIGMPTVWLNKF